MSFTLPELPYSKDALAPAISPETLEYHHGKHHKAYVDKLNDAIKGTSYADMELETLIKAVVEESDQQGVFNNAAQAWNHTFYWHCMGPNGGGDPTGPAADAINASFGDFATFKEKFGAAAKGQFGSGWAWVVKDGNGVAIETTSNADTPLAHGRKPVLTLDVWEHAYYIDYRNSRPDYIDAFWKVVNWDWLSKQLK